MGKRFTDTEKWTKNKWFRKLDVDYKLLWLFILDNCDAVGVWEEDLELVGDILLKREIEPQDVLEAFGDRIKLLKGGKKWLIVDFVSYQYNTLSKESRVHQTYISLIKKHGIEHLYDGLIIDQSNTIGAQRKRLTSKVKDEILAECEHRCQYCGYNEHPEILLVDHIVSLSKGGTNEKENLVAICPKCNSKKGDSDVFDFIKEQKLENNILDRLSKKLNTLSNFLDRVKEKEKEEDKEKEVEKENQINQKLLIPEMASIWKKENSTYVEQIKKDFEPLLKIAKFICDGEGIDFDLKSLDCILKVKANWEIITKYIVTHNHFKSYNLLLVEKHIQAITQSIHHGTGNNKGNSKPTVEQLNQAAFKHFG